MNAAADPVFADAKVPAKEPLAKESGKKAKEPYKVPPGQLFQATPEEKAAEQRRSDDHKIGLLIGPKNLVKLRAFGFDCKKIAEELSSGIAHRGMNE